jgi:hypothetical protein
MLPQSVTKSLFPRTLQVWLLSRVTQFSTLSSSARLREQVDILRAEVPQNEHLRKKWWGVGNEYREETAETVRRLHGNVAAKSRGLIFLWDLQNKSHGMILLPENTGGGGTPQLKL